MRLDRASRLSTITNPNSSPLAATQLTKAYGERTVIDDFEIVVEKGEIVIVKGPSGSGKSTLLHCLGGLLRPDRGSVLINGSDIVSMGEPLITRFRRRHIGYVFQWHGLLPDLTACENVAVASWAAGTGKTAALDKARRLLDTLRLHDVRDEAAQLLSGGEAQRVAIARALVNEPTVLLADEPTASLDRDTKHVVVELIASAASSDCAVVIATHDESVAEAGHRVLGIG